MRRAPPVGKGYVHSSLHSWGVKVYWIRVNDPSAGSPRLFQSALSTLKEARPSRALQSGVTPTFLSTAWLSPRGRLYLKPEFW